MAWSAFGSVENKERLKNLKEGFYFKSASYEISRPNWINLLLSSRPIQQSPWRPVFKLNSTLNMLMMIINTPLSNYASVSANSSLKPRLLLRCCVVVLQKDGDWYIYPQFLAHENLKMFIKTHRKVPTTPNLSYTTASFVPIGCVKLARYRG